MEAIFEHVVVDGKESNRLSNKLQSMCSPKDRSKIWRLLSQVTDSIIAIALSARRYHGFADTLIQSGRDALPGNHSQTMNDGEGKADIRSFLQSSALSDMDAQYQKIIHYLKERGNESHASLKRVCDLLASLVENVQQRRNEQNLHPERTADMPKARTTIQESRHSECNGKNSYIFNSNDVKYCSWLFAGEIESENPAHHHLFMTKDSKAWAVLTVDGYLYLLEQPYSTTVSGLLFSIFDHLDSIFSRLKLCSCWENMLSSIRTLGMKVLL